MVVYHDKNLIINFIPRSLDDATFCRIFSSIGPVKNCKIIRDKNTQNSYGFGFCEYEHPESALAAIKKLNGYQMEDKALKVSFARVQTGQTSPNLYVKGFPLWVTESHIIKHFGQFGRINHYRVLRNNVSKEPMCAAYVLFHNVSDAEAAKNRFDGYPWPDAPDSACISVKYASPPHKMNNKNTSQLSQSLPDVNVSPYQQPPVNSNFYLNQVNQITSQLLAAQITPTVNQQANIMPSLTNQQNIVSPCSVPPIPSNIYGINWQFPESQTNLEQLPIANTQYIQNQQACIQNQSPNLAQQQQFSFVWPPSIGFNALQNGQLTQQQPIPQRPDTFIQTNHLQQCNPVQNFSDVSTQNLTLAQKYPLSIPNNSQIKQDSSSFQQNYSVYVYNIGNYMTENQLFAHFLRFGDIISVSIPKDQATGYGKNFGFVLFGSYQSAKTAIEMMNGYKLQERTLQVSFKRTNQNQKKQTNYNNTSKPNGSDIQRTGILQRHDKISHSDESVKVNGVSKDSDSATTGEFNK